MNYQGQECEIIYLGSRTQQGLQELVASSSKDRTIIKIDYSAIKDGGVTKHIAQLILSKQVLTECF